jgi:inner membrane protein
MNTANLLTRNRATLKLMFVAVLSLSVLIPLFMVRSIILERQGLQMAAEQIIADRWGRSQHVGGLVALINSPVVLADKRSMERGQQWRANVLPALDISVNMTTEKRYLGIYEVPVYSSRIQIKGRLNWAMLDHLQSDGDLLFWLPLSDVRGVRKVSPLTIGSLQIPAKPLSVTADINTGLQFTLSSADRHDLAQDYSLELELSGSQSLQFLPLADTTRVHLESDWPHPEFVGQFLPVERSIEADGVQAVWQLLGLNRPYGDHWIMSEIPSHFLNTAGFGMRLDIPVDRFQRNERSVKYGFLFITLTFFTLFLFEVMTGCPLHPVPYVLTGAALVVFYLVLLALSEYLSFAGSFLIAASLLVLIVTPYTGTVLGARRRGYLAGAMMSITYVLLYVLVSSQHLSLLLGSLALLAAIASLMYLTRNVDWYDYGGSE